MRTHLAFASICLLAFAIVSCGPGTSEPSVLSVVAAPTATPKIDRRPAAAVAWRQVRTVPDYDPAAASPYQIDLRSSDLTALDLRQSADDLVYADFDSQTVWPVPDRMPRAYDWQRIMDLGANPGLGILTLQAHGITGRGVNIAIVDQPLLVEHAEYTSRLRLYEEVGVAPATMAQMHGPAVASIAVGEQVGVAPEANLYYIAAFAFDTSKAYSGTRDFHSMARAVRRILQINAGLPDDQKIRVLSMSVGWSPLEAGYAEMTAAVNDAKAAGIFVVSSNLEQTYGFKMHGLGRAPLADPDSFNSYDAGLFYASQLPPNGMTDRLLIPMDSRTVASPSSPDEYAFFRAGGWSWITPYLAGVYVLAAEVDPEITPERFWELAMSTGRTIELEQNGKIIPFGPILDPLALVKALNATGVEW